MLGSTWHSAYEDLSRGDALCVSRKIGQSETVMKLQRPSDKDLFDAASSGDWSRCAGATEEDVCRPIVQGRQTCLHIATAQGQLHKVPQHFVTMMNLMASDDNGVTPIEMILGRKAGHVFQLLQTPPLSPEMMEKLRKVIPEFYRDMVEHWEIRKSGAQANPTPTNNDQKHSKHLSLYDTLKEAATSGNWSKVPQTLLTVQNIMRADRDHGHTVIHQAAHAGQLHHVPPHLLTLETMLTQDKTKQMPYTVFREMEVRELSLDTIPNELRYSIVDYLKNKDPRPLIERFQTCIYAYDWNHLPEDLCTPENALLTTPNGLNCLLLAAYQENLELVPKQMMTDEALTAVYEFTGGDGKRYTTTALKVALCEQYDCIPMHVLSKHWDEIDPIIQDCILKYHRPLLRRDGSPSRPDLEL